MPGEITLCDNRSVERLVENIMPILELVSEHPKLFIPPQPRYVFDSCCADPEHGTNIGKEGYKEMILGNLTRIRNLLKHELIKRGVKSFWVLDSFAIVGSAKLADHEEVINNLELVTAEDGVHFSLLGYQNLAEEISKTIGDLQTGKIGQAKNRTPSGQLKTGKFFWRGFTSRHGSELHRHRQAGFGRAGSLGKGKFHPYRRN